MITAGVLFQAHKNVEVTHLGRYYETLNRHKHKLSLIEVNAPASLSTTATLKAGGLNISNVEVDMANRTLMDEHGFVYAPIPASFSDRQLLDGHWYVLVTEEGPCNNSAHNGTSCLGDQYYGKYDATDTRFESSVCAAMTDMRCGRIVEVRRGASGAPGRGSWALLHDLNKPLNAVNISPGTHPGNSISLVNLLFTDSGDSLKFAVNPQTNGCTTMTSEIFAGCRFELQRYRSSENNTTPLIKAKGDIIVTHLGRYKLSGNNKKHELRLIHYEPGKTYTDATGFTITRPQRYVTVAKAVVDLSGGTVGQFVYARLKTPVRISPTIPMRPETEVIYDAPAYFLVSRESGDALETFYGALDSSVQDAYGNPLPCGVLPQISIDANVFNALVRVKPGYFKIVNGALTMDGGGWITADPGGNSSLGLVDLLYQ